MPDAPSVDQNDTLALVGCGASKEDARTAAYRLYTSTYFQRKWAVASYLGDPAICSAKHCLVWAHERLDPYDETLYDYSDEECRAWAQGVADSIPDHYEHIVVLAGSVYVEPIVDAVDRPVTNMFAGCDGIHDQQSTLSEHLDAVGAEVAPGA